MQMADAEMGPNQTPYCYIFYHRNAEKIWKCERKF